MQRMCVQDIFCKIVVNAQDIEKMNSSNDQRKIYDLFCENGYDKSFNEFKTEMDDFLDSENVKKIMNDNFGELSEEMLELVAGGFSIKSTAKVGIAALMSAFTIASSVGPASATTIAPTPAAASITVESDYAYGNPKLNKEARDDRQQENKEANDNRQQLNIEASDNNQQTNKESNNNNQQENKESNDNNQQVNKESSDNAQQMSNGPLDFRIKDDKGTIGTAIKAENEQNSILPLVYNDNYFSHSSMEYNKSLAAASLALELSGFADHSELGREYTAQHKNAEDALKKLEFSDIKANESYTSKPGKDTIGVMTACKETNVNGEDVAIVPVVIRGGGYELEWFSNTDVGETGNNNNHKGFETAANSAKSYIRNYLKDIKGKIGNKKIKLWIVGYSRGGATAGMLTKSIDDDIRKDLGFGGFSLKHDDVYCYAFEPPKGLNKANSLFESNSGDFVSIDNDLYKNIHNVLNSKDVVTHVAPEQWGFVRPGVEHRLDEKKGQDNNKGMKDILNSFLINSDKKNAHAADLNEESNKIFNNLGGTNGYSAKIVKSLDDAISEMRKLAKKGKVKLPKGINDNRDFYSKIVQKSIGKVISLAMGSKEFKEELLKEISKPLISHEDGPLDIAKNFKDLLEAKDGTWKYGRTDTTEKGYFSDYLDTRYFYSIGEYIKFCGTAKSLDGHTERKASRAVCLTINRVIDRLMEKHANEPEYKKYLEGCKMKLITQYEKIDSKSDAKYKELFSQLKCAERKVDGGAESEKTVKYDQGKSEDELKKDLEIFRDVNARESDGYYVQGSWFGGYLNYVDENDEVIDEAVMADLIRTLFIALYKNSSNLTEYAQTMDYVTMASAEMHKPEVHLAQLINEDTDNTKLYQNLNRIIKSKYNKDEKSANNEVVNVKNQGYKYQLRKDKEDISWNDMEEKEVDNYRS